MHLTIIKKRCKYYNAVTKHYKKLNQLINFINKNIHIVIIPCNRFIIKKLIENNYNTIIGTNDQYYNELPSNYNQTTILSFKITNQYAEIYVCPENICKKYQLKISNIDRSIMIYIGHSLCKINQQPYYLYFIIHDILYYYYSYKND